MRHINTSLEWLSRNRYSILVAFLFIRFIAFASNGFWSGDFWEHSAVVKEFILRPSQPHHPLFLLSAPNAFMSPYALLVAIFARFLSLSSIEALSIFSLVNFLLLAYGIKRFCTVIWPNTAENTSFYFLLLTLLLWGNNPWPYSGFLHIEIIETVLPYPSTFCIALSLIGLSLFVEKFDSSKLLSNVILFLIVFFVLLSHPLTFIFLASGLFFLTFLTKSIQLIKLIYFIALISVAGITSFLWPYFSLYDLLVSGSKVYHHSNSIMYQDVWNRIWPNILLLPFLWLALRSRQAIIIVVWFLSLCILYVYGILSSNYSYGRIISYCIVLFHILAAGGISQLELNLEKTCSMACKLYRILLIVTLLSLSLYWVPYVATRLLTIANQIIKNNSFINQVSYKNLVFIKNFVTSDQLVLADLDTSWMIPTFGGKVIAALHPQAFIVDIFDRQNDVDSFFSVDANKESRLKVINKYRPQFLLLDLTKPVSKIIENELSEFLVQINSNDQYRLFEVLLN